MAVRPDAAGSVEASTTRTVSGLPCGTVFLELSAGAFVLRVVWLAKESLGAAATCFFAEFDFAVGSAPLAFDFFVAKMSSISFLPISSDVGP